MYDNAYTEGWKQPAWYALFVRSNQEKRVAWQLSSRYIEHFLPCYPSIRYWKDRRVKLEMPLFPGYLFVRLPLLDKLTVLTISNVVSLVGTRNVPSPIPNEDIEWIKRGIEHGKAEPSPYLKAGQRVMIIHGALAGMKGILLRAHNTGRIVISLDSIYRAFTVEIDLSSVEPVDPYECVTRKQGNLQSGCDHFTDVAPR